MKRFATALCAVLKRYAQFLGRAGTGVLLAGIAVLAAWAVVRPLWWLATERREVFSLVVAGAAAAALIAFLAARIARALRFSRRDARGTRRKRLLRSLSWVGLVLAAYASYLLWTKASPVAGGCLALAALLGAGMARDAARRTR